MKVTNITEKVTADELRDLFEQYGTITSLNLRPGNGDAQPHCFINFSAPEEAARAIAALDNHVSLRLTPPLLNMLLGSLAIATNPIAKPVFLAVLAKFPPNLRVLC